MKSYPKSVYADMATGHINQATAFGRPHTNPKRYHFIGKHYSFGGITAKFINQNMQLHIQGMGYDYVIDIPKSARKDRRYILKQEKEMQERIKLANTPGHIREKARKAVKVVAENPAEPDEERYWINCYQGAGVYRLAIKNGKIAAALYGGYYGSCPYPTKPENWQPVIRAELEKHGTVVKADGSGTYFFLRENSNLLETKNYTVPSIHGNTHLNIEII